MVRGIRSAEVRRITSNSRLVSRVCCVNGTFRMLVDTRATWDLEIARLFQAHTTITGAPPRLRRRRIVVLCCARSLVSLQSIGT